MPKLLGFKKVKNSSPAVKKPDVAGFFEKLRSLSKKKDVPVAPEVVSVEIPEIPTA
uniref:Uncharacterized protein n=1 Tax=viral metagenome TaxID=1070528 RepID=A0A6C0EQ42_9ZZZZ